MLDNLSDEALAQLYATNFSTLSLFLTKLYVTLNIVSSATYSEKSAKTWLTVTVQLIYKERNRQQCIILTTPLSSYTTPPRSCSTASCSTRSFLTRSCSTRSCSKRPCLTWLVRNGLVRNGLVRLGLVWPVMMGLPKGCPTKFCFWNQKQKQLQKSSACGFKRQYSKHTNKRTYWNWKITQTLFSRSF